jgi:hypothetical protein
MKLVRKVGQLTYGNLSTAYRRITKGPHEPHTIHMSLEDFEKYQDLSDRAALFCGARVQPSAALPPGIMVFEGEKLYAS